MFNMGEVVEGKWSKQKITVMRKLGAGANGQVYLVKYNYQLFAMKIHERSNDIALEWGILEQMDHISTYFPEPVMIDDLRDRPLYFYIMGLVNGKTLDNTLDMNDPSQIKNTLLQILSGLHELHKTNHAFCDIKPQNILLEQNHNGSVVKFVDVGGVTPFGRSVRQFTPHYDRAFWGLGQRIADAHYDISAVVLMCICLHMPPPKKLSEFTDKQRAEWLRQALSAFPVHSYIPFFEDILKGNILDAKSFLDKVMQASIQDSVRHKRGRPGNKVSKRFDWTERVMWGSICFAAVTTFAAWASFFGWF